MYGVNAGVESQQGQVHDSSPHAASAAALAFTLSPIAQAILVCKFILLAAFTATLFFNACLIAFFDFCVSFPLVYTIEFL
jgi:hypothetical protein